MLSGEKVRLVPVGKDELDAIISMRYDMEVWLLADDEPPAPRARADVEKEIEEHRKGDNAMFAIEADGKIIGDCGLHGVDNTARRCMLGISIGERDYWGKGYGRDAVKLLLDYAFRIRNMNKVALTVRADNERAIRAYKACGFVEEGRARDHVWIDGAYRDWLYMGILRAEWKPPGGQPGS